jgi:pimeloyl-ACP methyl ester carboxylesterase
LSTSGSVSTASGEQFARAGAVKLCYETFGSPQAEPLLLIMGLAAQMILWDDEFCEQLAAEGFWVIRFDNRDVGRSTIFRDAPMPKNWQLALRDKRAAAYTLDEMADDAVALLDHLELPSAHVVGVSMGGMLAQLVAIRHPDRVRSLVSIMSTTGGRRVGQPRPRIALRMLRPAPRGRDAFIAAHLETYRVIGSRAFDFEEDHKRRRAERIFERGVHPAGAARQLAAIITAPDRTPELRKLKLPATVIHGEQDPMVNISGGRATADAIPGARFVSLPGMGHDMPRPLWPEIIAAIAETARRGS